MLITCKAIESRHPNLLASKQICARYDGSRSHRSTPLTEEVEDPVCVLSICRLTATKIASRTVKERVYLRYRESLTVWTSIQHECCDGFLVWMD